MAMKPREVTVTLGKFVVTGKKIEADFTFDVTDKNVRYLTGMRHYAVGIQEPDLGQKKKYDHEYTANGMSFSVGKKGKGKLKFDDNGIVAKGLRHIHETDNSNVILFQTQELLPGTDEAEEDGSEDGQQEIPE